MDGDKDHRFEAMTAEEIEDYRAGLQAEIETLRAEMVRAGKVLERKRQAEPLEQKKAEIERALAELAPAATQAALKPAQSVELKPLTVGARIKSFLGR